jgi:hypothetical protein
MAITLNDLKQIVIKSEAEWLNDFHSDEGNDPVPYINGMKDEINECESIEDLLLWYETHGFNREGSYMCIIENLMVYGFVK